MLGYAQIELVRMTFCPTMLEIKSANASHRNSCVKNEKRGPGKEEVGRFLTSTDEMEVNVGVSALENYTVSCNPMLEMPWM